MSTSGDESLDSIFEEVKKEEPKKAETPLQTPPEQKAESLSLDDILPSETPALVATPTLQPAPQEHPQKQDDDLNAIFSNDSDKESGKVSANEESSEEGPEESLQNVQDAVKPLRRNISFEEVKVSTPKTVYVIYGKKGDGKTTLAFSFPGEIGCLSFDRKAAPIKASMFNNDKRIHVFDVVDLVNYGSPKEYIFSSEESFNYVCALLDELKNKGYDWIVLDGTEILSRTCEFAMRYRNNIAPFAGIKNRNLWKERRLYLNQVHVKAMAAAKMGIIYTTYSETEELIEDGEVIKRKDIPAWIDVVMTESDIVIKTENRIERGMSSFWATVESSKRAFTKTGTSTNITGIEGYNKITIIPKPVTGA
jgi:hypothetical protein